MAKSSQNSPPKSTKRSPSGRAVKTDAAASRFTKSSRSGAKSGAKSKKTTRYSAPPDMAPNGKSLVIVESPAKARTLNGYLGGKYHVQATVGHIYDLPPKRLGVDVDSGFEPEYEIIEGKEEVVESLKRNARNAREIFVATDPD